MVTSYSKYKLITRTAFLLRGCKSSDFIVKLGISQPYIIDIGRKYDKFLFLKECSFSFIEADFGSI